MEGGTSARILHNDPERVLGSFGKKSLESVVVVGFVMEGSLDEFERKNQRRDGPGSLMDRKASGRESQGSFVRVFGGSREPEEFD